MLMRLTAYIVPSITLKRGKVLLFFMVATMLSLTASAGIEPYSNSIRGAIKKGDSLIVRDEKFRSPFYNWNDIERQKTQNIISFRLFQDTNAVLPKSFNCDLTLKVEYYASVDQPEPLIIKSVTLKIKYSADSLYANKLLDTYTFENGYWVKLTVESVSSKEFGDKVPPFLELVSQIIVDRTYKHTTNKKLNTAYSFSAIENDIKSSDRRNMSDQNLSVQTLTSNTLF